MKPAGDIRLSIIVPIFNGAEFYDSFFSSIASQSISADNFEIICVDNNSDRACALKLERFCKIFKNARLLHYDKKSSSYAARNEGAAHAVAETLVFIDIDCMPISGWLQNIDAAVNGRTSVLLAGDVELVPEGGTFNIYEWFDKCSSLRQSEYAKEFTGATANLTVSKDVFYAVGGFLEIESGGDREFCRRVMKQTDAEFVFAPECLVYHPARNSFSEISKKLRRVARGKAYLSSKNSSFFRKLAFMFRQLIGLILMPNNWRIVTKTICEFRISLWSMRSCCMTIFFGFYGRFWTIKYCFSSKQMNRGSRAKTHV